MVHDDATSVWRKLTKVTQSVVPLMSGKISFANLGGRYFALSKRLHGRSLHHVSMFALTVVKRHPILAVRTILNARGTRGCNVTVSALIILLEKARCPIGLSYERTRSLRTREGVSVSQRPSTYLDNVVNGN